MGPHETDALWAFAADALEAEDKARVVAHVASCEECARKLTQVRQAQALLHTVRAEVPAVRWAETDERIQSAAARRLTGMERKPLWPWAFAAVGVMAALLALVVLRPSAPGPEQSAPVAVREEPSAPVAPAPREELAAREPSPAPVEPSPAPVAVATRVESAAGAWIREANAPERSLQAGTQLRSGSSVRTRAKSDALLRLPDESRVRLSPNSEVTLARTEAKDVQLTVTRGRLAVEASHVAREGFTVEAAGVRASVVGTVFSVECTERGAVVAVLEGKVRVETEGQPVRFVGAGERLEVRAGQPAPKARPLSAQDRRAFQELKAPPAEASSSPRPSPVPGSAAASRGVAPALVPESPASAPPPQETAPAEPASSAPVKSPSAVAGTALPGEEAAGSEIAPYPVPTSPEPLESMVVAPSTSAPEATSRTGSPAPWTPPEPGGSEPDAADARFLWHAREQLAARTCESFLVGLAELAERSRVREFREQARYLRARCFEERLAKAEAEAEYRRYLREFPKGRYVKEARAALLP
ncbi:FecR domain-containing protein [Hyalangium gracile]|uniref:FecR domain-containing protein n=1 Tax=Hyalangium gracile TaxID=394092 RepID=UPI001CCD78B4|nr:FecR domain-containing protein [Hyalangium gracile]